MNKKYKLRKNVFITAEEEHKIYKAKVAFKTEQLDWVNTKSPSLILVSVNSSFHQGIWGKIKMESLYCTLKNHLQTPPSVLIAEQAHLHVDSLYFSGEMGKATLNSTHLGKKWLSDFKELFKDDDPVFMHRFILSDPLFTSCKMEIESLYKSDGTFQKLLYQEALETYSCERKLLEPNADHFAYLAKEDIKLQCAMYRLLAKKGFHYIFYPGLQYQAVEYANRTLGEPALTFIHVFISLEKKRTELLSFESEHCQSKEMRPVPILN